MMDLIRILLRKMGPRPAFYIDVEVLLRSESMQLNPRYNQEGVCHGFYFGRYRGGRGKEGRRAMTRLSKALRETPGWELQKYARWWWILDRDMAKPIDWLDISPERSGRRT